METVNKVVDAGYKAIWGDCDDSKNVTLQPSQPSGSSKTPVAGNSNITGIESVDKVVNAGKRAIWGPDNKTDKPHGDEPISGVTGKGTATDPYDAGNRDGTFLFPLIGINQLF
jgi:hypothetical protein